VSREILQHSAPLEKIRSNLTTKVLNTLEEMKRRDHENYLKFYRELGAFLKEGAYQDWNNREKLADLLLFESTKTDPGKLTGLAEYVERMPGEQTEIYYLAGEGRELLEQSPLLESFRAKSWEVLLLTEPADEFVADSMREYKGKKLRAIDKAGLDQAGVSDELKTTYQPLLDYLKEKLPDIKEARLTSRLKESAVCLVAEEGAMSAHMERILHRMGRGEQGESQRILEVNPEHPTAQALRKLVERDRNDPRLESYARLLYDQAVILEGSKVKDPLALARRINEMMVKDAN
jgi:molecular chaperone HtpG